MQTSALILALALSSASALNSFRLKAAQPAPVVPENEKPLAERLGGVGLTEPFAAGFDPLGLAGRADAAEMIKYREAELKHGRVAMLAVPGFLLSEDFHPFFPGLPKGEFGIFASQDTWEQSTERPLLLLALLAVGLFEAQSFAGWESPTAFASPAKAPSPGDVGVSGRMRADYVPGATFPKGPWTSEKLSPEKFLAKQNTELNNGRLAMVSIALIVLQELATGLPAEVLDLDVLGLVA